MHHVVDGGSAAVRWRGGTHHFSHGMGTLHCPRLCVSAEVARRRGMSSTSMSRERARERRMRGDIFPEGKLQSVHRGGEVEERKTEGERTTVGCVARGLLSLRAGTGERARVRQGELGLVCGREGTAGCVERLG